MTKESKSNLKSRTIKIIKLLKKYYPDSKCSLTFNSAHQLLVATILSAQCTDERVNMVTPNLFKKYRSVKAFADADISELEDYIRSTGFFKNKARAIKNSALMIINDFSGRIPRSLDEIVKLPGVGRKTGSVVLGTAFEIAEGIVVDTHVSRISQRLELTGQKNPDKIEADLMKIIPYKDWVIYSHLMIDFGRSVCKARKPDCSGCFLSNFCPSKDKF